MKFKSLIEATQYFSNEQTCIDFLIQIRWNGTVTCPTCQCTKIYELKGKFKRYKCTSCKKQFSVIKGTIFENSQVPLQKWMLGIFLHGYHRKGISSCQLAKDLNVTQKTAWFMLHRIRFMLATKSVEVVDGIVELDETFVGGKNKNRPRHKKVKQSQGRSFKDKTPVMGVLQREEAHIIERPNKVEPHKVVREKVVTRESKIQCQVVPNTKAKSLQPIITSAVKAGTIVVSDEWYAYRGLHARYQHHTVDHGKGQYADADGYNTNTIEGAWSQLKRTIIGTYHQVSRKHLQKYVDEFTFRYNTRKVTVDEILDHAMVNVNSRLTYKDLVGKTIQKVVAKEHN